MLKKILLTTIGTVLITVFVRPQDNILQRIILIGDAGEMDTHQKAVIANAAEKVLQNKTTVLYLGDNVYPKGMALTGNADTAISQEILRSQFLPMRNKGAAVYFIPGNHDWDRMGPKGLEKIKLQWQFLEEQHDSSLQLVPANGCPDPYEINVSDNLTIIAFDSEWWLYPFSKDNPDAACDCKTKDEIVARLEELVYKNRYKIILLASHHPFQSYGRHGGYFSWKDHLFPLTAANKNLYVPLPIIGSLYPLLRSTFPNPEELRHPLYQDMIKKTDAAIELSPNVTHVAGHEHGLQLIKNEQLQVVSGSGSKNSYVRKNKKGSLFGEAVAGFATADLLTDSSMLFTYYTYGDSGPQQSFSHIRPYSNLQVKEAETVKSIVGDSITVMQHPSFDSVGNFYRFLFGENYRKEYAAPTTLPVIRISSIKGGLTPTKRGGGHQSRSLRLKDKDGKEWALRSVDKYPEVVLPEQLRETFAKDWIRDAMSAQHPYSALVVPVIAQAAKVPSSNPVIGYIAPDPKLGIYSKLFANTVCLLEEREPTGKSDNTPDMIAALNDDNDNSIDSSEFFRARLLDLFLGDWDRHDDQWRWAYEKRGSGKKYIAVPRDRDQVFHVMQGVFPTSASRPWIAPFLHNFDGKIKNVNAFFFESKYLNARFLNQLTYDEWTKQTDEFAQTLTDDVLEKALLRLPASSYKLRHESLLNDWKERRGNLPAAMNKYYHFFNKIVDIQTTDKNELIEVKDAPNNGLTVTIHKISKERAIKDQLFTRTFDPNVTKEIRLFIAKGDDSILLDNKTSNIKLRIVGGEGNKTYSVLDSKRKVQVYEKQNNAVFTGNTNRLHKHLSDDSLNTAIINTNLYNVTAPLIAAGYNIDDGILLGLGFKHTQQGFRKQPYASVQSFTIAHSFSTKAFRIRYKGEWIKAIGNADFTLNATAFAPNNTMNFFGRGNETEYDKTGDYKTYYRTRFSLYQGYPALRWLNNKGTEVSFGPAAQYYTYDSSENTGRFINKTNLINSYDSNTIANDKVHAGVILNFVSDRRNNKLMPSWGSYVVLRFEGLAGLNSYSKSFGRIVAEASLYKSVNTRSTIVIAERFGGVATLGKTTFYQSAFLGGHENLRGFRQFRFAGEHLIYNNLEARIKLANFASYILPGQFGLLGSFDIGRVWIPDEKSHTWHHGTGMGIYFAPAQMAILQIVAGRSKEGWYPYISMGFRF